MWLNYFCFIFKSIYLSVCCFGLLHNVFVWSCVFGVVCFGFCVCMVIKRGLIGSFMVASRVDMSLYQVG